MNINPSTNPSPESQAKINLDKLFSNPSVNAQSEVQCKLYLMIAGLIMVYEILGITRGACSALMIQAGFKSADETANAGHLLGAGGLVLGATGVVQGVGKFKEAKGVAEATQIRSDELKSLDKEFAAKDLNQDVTVEVEAVDEPCTSNTEDLILEVEEDALCNTEETLSTKENKTQGKVEDVKQENASPKNRVFGDIEKNKRIKLVNKKYDVRVDQEKNNSGKFQTVGTPGQAAYYVTQGLSEHQKAKSQKESLVQQVQQDNQQQQANTADGVKKEIDKLADFDPFQRNSSSQR